MIDEKLAIDISKIANRLSFAPNFINYSYKEEMVGDAIEKMFRALRNQFAILDISIANFSSIISGLPESRYDR